MAAARALLIKSSRAAMDTLFCIRYARPCISSIEIPRFSMHRVSLELSIYVPNKHSTSEFIQRLMEEKQNRSFTPPFIETKKCKNDSSHKQSTFSSGSERSMKNMFSSQLGLSRWCLSAKCHHRAYSSQSEGKPDGIETAIQTAGNAKSSNIENTGSNVLVDMFDHARQSAVDAIVIAGNKSKDLSDQVTLYMRQLYDANPYMEKVIVPVGGTLFATILAWFVMPKIFRRLHKYASQTPLALLTRNSGKELVPYEKSFWCALEDPARYLVTFMAFSELGVMIAPTTAQYLSQAWRGAAVLSFVWFLYRWKTNFFASSLANQATVVLDREKLLTLERLSSVGLMVLAVMALAEAFGVPIQSIVTVGGIGGVATAFAARDILGNLLSGLSLQFSKPFVVGDNIKAGLIEGQVMEMGLTTTCLINIEKFPVIVPNSLFSSQVIVNKSRAQWRASLNKVPIRISDIEKVPLISEEIKSMLLAHPKVFLEKDAPFCYLSRIDQTFAELTLGCNLKSMKKDELLAWEQDILLQAVRIIRQHGAELGGTTPEYAFR